MSVYFDEDANKVTKEVFDSALEELLLQDEQHYIVEYNPFVGNGGGGWIINATDNIRGL